MALTTQPSDPTSSVAQADQDLDSILRGSLSNDEEEELEESDEEEEESDEEEEPDYDGEEPDYDGDEDESGKPLSNPSRLPDRSEDDAPWLRRPDPSAQTKTLEQVKAQKIFDALGGLPPKVVYLDVYLDRGTGHPSSLGRITDISTRELIRKFIAVMPKLDDDPVRLILRPVDANGRKVGSDHLLPIDPAHSDLVSIRKQMTSNREDTSLFDPFSVTPTIASGSSPLATEIIRTATSRADQAAADRERLVQENARKAEENARRQVEESRSTQSRLAEANEKLTGRIIDLMAKSSSDALEFQRENARIREEELKKQNAANESMLRLQLENQQKLLNSGKPQDSLEQAQLAHTLRMEELYAKDKLETARMEREATRNRELKEIEAQLARDQAAQAAKSESVEVMKIQASTEESRRAHDLNAQRLQIDSERIAREAAEARRAEEARRLDERERERARLEQERMDRVDREAREQARLEREAQDKKERLALELQNIALEKERIQKEAEAQRRKDEVDREERQRKISLAEQEAREEREERRRRQDAKDEEARIEREERRKKDDEAREAQRRKDDEAREEREERRRQAEADRRRQDAKDEEERANRRRKDDQEREEREERRRRQDAKDEEDRAERRRNEENARIEREERRKKEEEYQRQKDEEARLARRRQDAKDDEDREQRQLERKRQMEADERDREARRKREEEDSEEKRKIRQKELEVERERVQSEREIAIAELRAQQADASNTMNGANNLAKMMGFESLRDIFNLQSGKATLSDVALKAVDKFGDKIDKFFPAVMSPSGPVATTADQMVQLPSGRQITMAQLEAMVTQMERVPQLVDSQSAQPYRLPPASTSPVASEAKPELAPVVQPVVPTLDKEQIKKMQDLTTQVPLPVLRSAKPALVSLVQMVRQNPEKARDLIIAACQKTPDILKFINLIGLRPALKAVNCPADLEDQIVARVKEAQSSLTWKALSATGVIPDIQENNPGKK